MCLDHAKTTYFTGDDDSGYEPLLCYKDLSDNVYLFIGELFAMSIRQSGPAPAFLKEWVATYLCYDIKDLTLPLSLRGDCEKWLAAMYDKLTKVDTDEALVQLMTSDLGYDLISRIGYRGVPKKIDDKASLLR